ncbi:pantoate--beta-alanine ligase [Leucobacter insecticola]|uniref:Pantothenate synthetase n=1 Tax=Leucobacter insecticola TaxID=2714934 RepID=A0A6G8FHG3_9MICO|nr:pantoate--beta-alanine ligase [Leucobacter insecticola]QIM15801.1 pantoate--beta-alanine ligase [Leucobacter insecticola]
MRIVRTIHELRDALQSVRTGGSIGAARVGMVPTMGALHEGHLSLVRTARAENDCVVMSIFVNPTQFGEAADLAAYPRQEAQDVELAESAGVDLVFAPSVAEMYPTGFATAVHVSGPLTEVLEGAGRGSAHFDGVATIVSKLLLAVLPDNAYFGQKDAQQLRVVQRMTQDLGIPTRIRSCPTLRDEDGLALSSRNALLSDTERASASRIPSALTAVTAALAAGDISVSRLRAVAEEVLVGGNLDVEYVEIVDPDTFESVKFVERPALCAIAARVGTVRLIDNTLLVPQR